MTADDPDDLCTDSLKLRLGHVKAIELLSDAHTASYKALEKESAMDELSSIGLCDLGMLLNSLDSVSVCE